MSEKVICHNASAANRLRPMTTQLNRSAVAMYTMTRKDAYSSSEVPRSFEDHS